MSAMADPRALVVTTGLLRLMARDVTRLLLATRRLLPLWGAIVAGSLVGGALLATGERRTGVVLLLWAAVVAAALVLRARRAARRSLAAVYPPGATVTVRLAPDGLHVDGPVRGTRTAWEVFRDLRVHGSVVVLRHRGSHLATVVPRALLTDDDHARVRELLR